MHTKQTAIALALAASLGGFMPAAQADITYSFSSLSLSGFTFQQIAGNLAGLVSGTLTSVSINATLDASVNDAYADDLTVYVDALPLSAGGLLQIGGFSSLGAAERHGWATGASADVGTVVSDSVTLTAPISFDSASSNLVVWLGNGYNDPDALGTWTGTVTLTGLSAAPVPEPSSLLLAALGGLGLMAWVANRRRSAPASQA